MRVRGLVLAALLAGCRGESVSAPSPGVDVERYDVSLSFDPATLRLDGRVSLTVAPADSARVLDLRLGVAMDVAAVRVDGRATRFERRADRLGVPLPPGGRGRVEVIYGGIPAEGVYAGEAAGQRVVFTDAWPQRSAGWLPAVHHPSDPAALTLALTVPHPWEVVASGAFVGTDTLAEGRTRWRFRLGEAAPVHTFAFAAADFTVVADTLGPVPIRHHLLAAHGEAAPALGRTRASLDTLSALLGPYPFDSYATVQVPLSWDGMENAAAPFLRAGLYAEQGMEGVPAVEEVQVHELVHQWFGTATPTAAWHDLWLAEGPATYLTTVFYERADPPASARRRRVLMARMNARDAERPLVPSRLRRPADALSATVYQKGGCVLHTLRLRVGDRAFFAALRRAAQRDGRPLSTAAFQTILEETSGRDLDPFFAFWVYDNQIPALVTTWDAPARRLSWRVENDAGTLAGLPFELLVRQPGRDQYLDARTGTIVLPGSERPEVFPVGVLLRVAE